MENKLEKIGQNSFMDNFVKTDDILNDMCGIIESSQEAAEQTWSVRTLQRNISSQYYYRMPGTQKKELVESEMKELTAPYQSDKLEFIKNPVVAEFLGFSQNTDFTESDLEKSILSNLQKFLMELGKGYALWAEIFNENIERYLDVSNLRHLISFSKNTSESYFD